MAFWSLRPFRPSFAPIRCRSSWKSRPGHKHRHNQNKSENQKQKGYAKIALPHLPTSNQNHNLHACVVIFHCCSAQHKVCRTADIQSPPHEHRRSHNSSSPTMCCIANGAKIEGVQCKLTLNWSISTGPPSLLILKGFKNKLLLMLYASACLSVCPWQLTSHHSSFNLLPSH